MANDNLTPKPPYIAYMMEGLGGSFSENDATITIQARIVFEDHIWDEKELNESPFFPRRYSAHPDRKLANSGFRVLATRWTRNKNLPQVCDLEITYSNKLSDQQQVRNKDIEYEEDPTKRPPVISWGTYTTMEGQDMAFDDPVVDPYPTLPIQTTALEPIIFKRQFKRRAITITYNSPIIPDWFLENYDIVNSDAIKLPKSPFVSKKYFTFPRNTLLLYDATASTEQLENDFRFFKITIILHHNNRGWHYRPRNVGRQAFYIIKRKNAITGEDEFVRSSTPSLIKIGSPVPELPMNPLPLRNTPDNLNTHGLVFEDYYNYDPTTGKQLYDQDPITVDRLKEIFEEATLDFAVYREAPFIALIPGIAFFN